MTSTLSQIAGVSDSTTGGAPQSTFSQRARYFSDNPLLANVGFKSFFNASEVDTFFGPTSQESSVARMHFSTTSKRGRANNEIQFDYYSLTAAINFSDISSYIASDFPVIQGINGDLTLTFTGRTSGAVRAFSGTFNGSSVTSILQMAQALQSWLTSAVITGGTATANASSVSTVIPFSALGSQFLATELISAEWSSTLVSTPSVPDKLKLTPSSGALIVPMDGRTPAQQISDSVTKNQDCFGIGFVGGINGGLSASQLAAVVSVFSQPEFRNNYCYAFETTLAQAQTDLETYGQAVGVVPCIVRDLNDLAALFQISLAQTWDPSEAGINVFDFDLTQTPSGIEAGLQNDSEYNKYSNPIISKIAANSTQRFEVLGVNYRTGNMWGPISDKMNLMEFLGNKWIRKNFQLLLAYQKQAVPVLDIDDVENVILSIFAKAAEIGVVVPNRTISTPDIPNIISVYGPNAINNLTGKGFAYIIKLPVPVGSGFSTVSAKAIYGGVNSILKVELSNQIYV